MHPLWASVTALFMASSNFWASLQCYRYIFHFSEMILKKMILESLMFHNETFRRELFDRIKITQNIKMKLNLNYSY